MAYRDHHTGNGKESAEKSLQTPGKSNRFDDNRRRFDAYRYEGENVSGLRRTSGSRRSFRKEFLEEVHYIDKSETAKSVKTAVQEHTGFTEEPDERYILTGRNPIREALKTNRDLEKLLVQKGELSGSAKEIVKTAKDRKIIVQEVEKSRLDEIAPRHQGLIAFASAFSYSTVDHMLKKAAELGEDPFLILLDGITDPHNLGAIIRSAECAGAHGVIVPQHRSVGLTPAAVKASAGAIEYIPIARVTNLNRTIEELKKRNIWVYALTMNGRNYEDIEFSGGTAVVIGSEGEGISKLTEGKCDISVSLPMKGHLDSLNASVAAGVIMYRIMSSREKE